jgi:quercetin dioxygenase-like cupin family protein
MESKHVKMNELVWEQVRAGVARKVVHGEKGTVVLNRLESGHEPRPHKHPHEQIAIIIKGQSRFTVGEKVYELGEGDIVTIPPNVMHFAEVTNGEDCYNLDVFVPRREDYVDSQGKDGSDQK